MKRKELFGQHDTYTVHVPLFVSLADGYQENERSETKIGNGIPNSRITRNTQSNSS